MIDVKIIGVGSPYGDDQLGLRIIEILSQNNELRSYKPEHLVIEYYDRPGIRLLEYMKDAKIVILVDALVTKNKVPGTCYRFQNDALYDANFPISSHGIGVGEALQLGKALNCLPKGYYMALKLTVTIHFQKYLLLFNFPLLNSLIRLLRK